MVCVLDEDTRECLVIVPASRLRTQDVFLTLSGLMRIYCKPETFEATTGRSSLGAR